MNADVKGSMEMTRLLEFQMQIRAIRQFQLRITMVKRVMVKLRSVINKNKSRKETKIYKRKEF